MRQSFLLVTVLLLGSFLASAQDDLDNDKNDSINKVKGKEKAANNVGAIKVRDNIYMLKGRGGNIGQSSFGWWALGTSLYA